MIREHIIKKNVTLSDLLREIESKNRGQGSFVRHCPHQICEGISERERDIERVNEVLDR